MYSRRLGDNTARDCHLTFLSQNVCDEARWARVVQETETRFGNLNILVNNAGILGPMETVNPENTSLVEWRQIFAVNVEGVFLGCRAAIPAMKRAGGGIYCQHIFRRGIARDPLCDGLRGEQGCRATVDEVRGPILR